MDITKTLEKLKGHVPDVVLAELPDVIQKFEINTTLRLCHFLAQCAHESGGFKAKVENLNYSVKRLTEIFKKYFPTNQKALEYQRQPEKIANLVYGNRMGNGAESTGDGWRYRGRGYIQLTGKDAYRRFGAAIGEDIVQKPELVASKYPLVSAAWFFHTRGINKISDRGATEDVVTAVTLRVNGGRNGLQDRLFRFNNFFKILND
jgi:putative chitinase